MVAPTTSPTTSPTTVVTAALYDGFWGPATAGVDWCEENYTLSYYIAEFYNTMSNLLPLYLCVVGLFHGLRKINSNKNVSLRRQPTIIAFAYIVIIMVYTGSFLFHATLTHVGQYLDEVPMIFGSVYLHFILTAPNHRIVASIISIIVSFGVPAVMVYTHPNPIPLRLSYAILVLSLVIRSFVLCLRSKLLWSSRILQQGFYLYGLGVILWLLEQAICPTLQSMQLHAWWHVLTGCGTYCWIQFASLYVLETTYHKHHIHYTAGLPFVMMHKNYKQHHAK